MPLDSRYIVTSDLESYFVDKDTGEPLAGGIITFYSQTDHSVKKPVYELTVTGTDTFEYNPLPNPSILSDVGTFQDEDGNNIVPYYFPYNSQGEPELYYITVEDADGVEQFTRSGWPNFTPHGDVDTEQDINYIPNGQFIAHNDHIETGTTTIGAYAYQNVAQGGWLLVTPASPLNTYEITFTSVQNNYQLDYPRYYINFHCTNNSNDSVRDLAIAWRNVFMFQSPDPGNPLVFTLFFAAQSNTAASFTFDIFFLQYYGTGGNPSTIVETPLNRSVTITPSQQYFTINDISFPTSTGTRGENADDDFVAIAFRGPQSSNFDVQMTDFAFLLGDVAPTSFPINTDAQMMAQTTAGWLPKPAPNNADLYLPILLGPAGFVYDNSIVGKIFPCMYEDPGIGELLCDGSAYLTDDYSDDGIPYSRLQAVLYNTSLGIPIFGTGANNLTAYIQNIASTDYVRITSNKAGAVLAGIAQGTTSTTMTLATIHTATTTYNVRAAKIANAQLYITGLIPGGVTPASAQTSGFTVATAYDNSAVNMVMSVTVPGLPAAGSYFFFNSNPADTGYYVWFKVDGVGADPAIVGRTGIQINILSTYTVGEVANVLVDSLNDFEVSSVLALAAAAIPNNSWFQVTTTNVTYSIWFNKDGAGTEPAGAPGTKIEVAITTGQTASQVAVLIFNAINTRWFAVPDLRGIFLRGWNDGSGNDPSAATRFSLNVTQQYFGDNIGTTQYYLVNAHNHPGSYVDGVNGAATAPAFVSALGTSTANQSHIPITVAQDGGVENRPTNVSVNYVIKY